MFSYYLHMSLANINRQKGLSALIACTLGIGIAACMITYGLIHLMSKDPLPSKSDNVYHVQLDNWPLHESAVPPNLPPEEVTWREAINIVHAKQAKYQAANALTWGMVTPADKNVPPFLGIIRATHGEFFPMFEVPFLYGQAWANFAVNEAKYITVLSKVTNDQVFAGQNSVGKTIPMLGKLFTVVGVLDNWQPSPKFYDLSMGPFSQPEDLYIPLQLKAELELPHGGNSHCWENNLANTYSAFLNSECINFNLWVEFTNKNQKQQFEQFLHTYTTQQKALGRFPKNIHNILLNLNQWLDYKAVVSTDIYLFFYLALLFLAVCVFNAASLISNIFSKKSAEIALRRALGANQQSIFIQCITETLILGTLGALIGLTLSVMGFAAIKQLYPDFNNFEFFELSLILLTITLSLVSSMIAGAIPSMRVCRLAPAVYLK